MEWKPIETAPKDGMPILLGRSEVKQIVDGFVWGGVKHVNQGAWIGGKWMSFLHPEGAYPANEFMRPTHWMPLPEPPKD